MHIIRFPRQFAAFFAIAVTVVFISPQALTAPEVNTPDQSVTWQNNARHDGNNPSSPLVTPLTLKWKRDLSAHGINLISYPLIAEGRIFVTTDDSNSTELLMAFDEVTGRRLWSAEVGGTYGFASAAFDAGKVFVVNYDGLMKALDAATGNLLWSVALPGQYAFTSPPAATHGMVFTGGAGSGGTVYGVDGTSGAVVWTMPVENGDSSSPAIDGRRLFVSYACPQAYGFATTTGQLLWHYSGACEGGGGATPVPYQGKVYVRDVFFEPTNGIILDATTGTKVGGFNSNTPPAFVGTLALYFQSGMLVGVDVTTGQTLWTFAGDGTLITAPLIVNGSIYVGGSSGMLFALDLNGQQLWSTQVGAAISGSNEGGASIITGLGAGDGLLVVPAGSVLAVYGN